MCARGIRTRSPSRLAKRVPSADSVRSAKPATGKIASAPRVNTILRHRDGQADVLLSTLSLAGLKSPSDNPRSFAVADRAAAFPQRIESLSLPATTRPIPRCSVVSIEAPEAPWGGLSLNPLGSRLDGISMVCNFAHTRPPNWATVSYPPRHCARHPWPSGIRGKRLQ